MDREGFVIGEGAGVMVLEEYEQAKKRGAKIYCELSGYGMSADAYHITAPSIDGPKRSMNNALKNAGINPDQIQYVNAHGTSTPLGDLNETNAIKETFGNSAYQIVVNSTKSMTGHLLGGAGGNPYLRHWRFIIKYHPPLSIFLIKILRVTLIMWLTPQEK